MCFGLSGPHKQSQGRVSPWVKHLPGGMRPCRNQPWPTHREGLFCWRSPTIPTTPTPINTEGTKGTAHKTEDSKALSGNINKQQNLDFTFLDTEHLSLLSGRKYSTQQSQSSVFSSSGWVFPEQPIPASKLCFSGKFSPRCVEITSV